MCGQIDRYSREDRLALKPAGVTFEQAAAVPVAALTRGDSRPERPGELHGERADAGAGAVDQDLLSRLDGGSAPKRLQRVLTCAAPGGTYLAVGTPSLTHLLAMKMASPLVRQKVVVFMARIRSEDLRMLADLLEAIRHVESGHTRGKWVVTVDA